MPLLMLDEHCSSESSINRQYANWRFDRYFDPQFASTLNAELDRLSDLGNNWDGYDASPLNTDFLRSAKGVVKLIEGYASRPTVVPLSPGGVQFEWHSGQKSLELGIEEVGEINYLKFDPRHGTDDAGTVEIDDVDGVRSLVRWFMEGIE